MYLIWSYIVWIIFKAFGIFWRRQKYWKPELGSFKSDLNYCNLLRINMRIYAVGKKQSHKQLQL